MRLNDPFETLHQAEIAAFALKFLQPRFEILAQALRQISIQPADHAFQLIHKAVDLGRERLRQFSISPHVLGAALVERDSSEGQRHADRMKRSELRFRRLHALAFQRAKHLGAGAGDIITHHPGLRARQIRLVFRKWRLRFGRDQDRFNFAEQLVNVLATRQKVQLLRGVQ
ncbi:MAG TPA: hypothetical protein VMB85_18580 [Bryobacteraceae bacterium]|nr:hypothetical protein [Bryobacteraceae bacterium]